MNLNSKQEILEALRLPWQEFDDTIGAEARRIRAEVTDNRLVAVSMMGFTNVCKNQCLYCGMRAGNANLKRYRMEPETVIAAAQQAAANGFKKIFLISGEDPKYGFENLVKIVAACKEAGLHVSLACGEFSKEQFRILKEAGADRYVAKFEMSNEASFNRLNPSTNFKHRMECIHWIKEAGLELASGNIVDWPGQTEEELAEDILRMKQLEIDWAPIVPYMPAMGTPLAAEGGRGSIEKNLREISLLRVLLPEVYITAGQPGENLKEGFASPSGNLAALRAGADMMYTDLLPNDLSDVFRVEDNRILLGMEHIRAKAEQSGSKLQF